MAVAGAFIRARQRAGLRFGGRARHRRGTGDRDAAAAASPRTRRGCDAASVRGRVPARGSPAGCDPGGGGGASPAAEGRRRRRGRQGEGDRPVKRGIPFDLAHAAGLPTEPGVYLFHGTRGEVLYVGKAKSLRHRVRSYLAQGTGTTIRTRELARQTRLVETLVVGSEAEALILEANLIKEHQPRFNIQLRDDKKYPYIKVTANEPFPRVFVTRRVRKDGSRYFGPFVSVGRVRRALEVVKRLHGIRSCRYNLPRESPVRPCLDHHIGRCAAPCVGLQSREDYGEMVDRVMRILSGEVASLQAGVEEDMHKASSAMDFERAAHLRDILAGLTAIARQQRVQSVGGGDRDAVGVARDGPLAVAVALRIRGGVLIGRDTHTMTGVEEVSDAELLSRSVTHAYLSSGRAGLEQLPHEILLPSRFPDLPLLAEVLAGRAPHGLSLRVPKRGAKVRLVELAVVNARHALADQVRKGESALPRTDDILFELQDCLGLKVVPRLIACFDISHTQGAETVAGVAVFLNAEPRRAGYRHMRIRGEWGNDDYRSMAEAVSRYFAREATGEGPLPDLVLIDGGKGQLRAAAGALDELELGDIALAALAKREEAVFLPGRREEVRIPRSARSLHLLQRVRDEAHRVAVSYNRKLRTRRTVRSELRDIPGLGPRREQALLSRFGSLRGVSEASAAEIGRIPGFSEATGAKILTWLGRRSR
ncbi:MAG: excinuclease ABC subunit UvrC [Gemmatimonadetes bacterium]|nr:excinuclease ABC subunit UvrC [Gemmatimonadota bacterium]MYD12186.1 excinuclease ABC subunit UvrC [Gemmatimonadota bacterium]